MDTSRNRKLLIAIGVVVFFVVIVLVWYFFYAKPVINPTLSETNNPLPQIKTPPRFQFLSWGNDEEPSTITEVIDPLKNPLTQIWDRPSTGQTFIIEQILQEGTTTVQQGTSTVEVRQVTRATSTTLLFVDKTTGYIYAHSLRTKGTYQVSNTLIPGIHDAYFFANGKRIIIRYIDRQKNTVVGLIASVPSVSESGDALPLRSIQYLNSEVVSVAVNKKNENASYIVAAGNGSAIYTIGSKEPLFIASSPFKSFDLHYGGEDLFVTTKPSAYVEGTTFHIPSFQSEISDKTGLMSSFDTSSFSLNSMWGKGGLVTFFNEKGNLTVLTIKTLASKCRWGFNDFLICAVPRTLPFSVEGLPDDWFQGRASLSDDLFIIDKDTGQEYTLYSFKDTEGTFDITNISLNNENDVLSFTKKQDGSLWLLTLGLIGGE